MSITSLRKDHELIEIVLKAMWATIPLLKSGKTIPEPILIPVIDFTKLYGCLPSWKRRRFFVT